MPKELFEGIVNLVIFVLIAGAFASPLVIAWFIYDAFFGLDAREARLEKKIWKANKKKDRPAQRDRIKEMRRELKRMRK